MAVTASWITKEAKLHEVTIGFRQIVGDIHNGVNISTTFWNILCEFKIENKVIELYTVPDFEIRTDFLGHKI